MVHFPDLDSPRAQMRFGDRAEVPVTQLTKGQCDFLATLYRRAGPKHEVRATQLATLCGTLGDSTKRYEAQELEEFLADLLRYLLADGLRGWLFSADISRRPLPYVVTRLDYTPTSNDMRDDMRHGNGDEGQRMTDTAGYFIDWNGKARSIDDPGDGYVCDVDQPARYVAVTTPTGTLVHEATLYRSLEHIAKAGITAELVPGSTPWGKPDEGF